jgi:hypothetical protein
MTIHIMYYIMYNEVGLLIIQTFIPIIHTIHINRLLFPYTY